MIMKYIRIRGQMLKIIKTRDKEINLKIPKNTTIIIIEEQKGRKK
jgi:hypothetical protein